MVIKMGAYLVNVQVSDCKSSSLPVTVHILHQHTRRRSCDSLALLVYSISLSCVVPRSFYPSLHPFGRFDRDEESPVGSANALLWRDIGSNKQGFMDRLNGAAHDFIMSEQRKRKHDILPWTDL